MRSSESANTPRIAISLRISSRLGNSASATAAAAQKASSPRRQRPRRARSAWTRSASACAMAIRSARSSEQALRAQDQDDDHERVDDEAAEGRDVIFAGDVGDAEEER